MTTEILLWTGPNFLVTDTVSGSRNSIGSQTDVDFNLSTFNSGVDKRVVFQKGGFGGCSPGAKTGTRVHSDVPRERKPERGCVRMFPRNENQNEGTSAQTALLRNRPFLPVINTLFTSALLFALVTRPKYPPYRKTDVAIPLSHYVSCGITDYRCYTPTSFRKNGLSQSKDRP